MNSNNLMVYKMFLFTVDILAISGIKHTTLDLRHSSNTDAKWVHVNTFSLSRIKVFLSVWQKYDYRASVPSYLRNQHNLDLCGTSAKRQSIYINKQTAGLKPTPVSEGMTNYEVNTSVGQQEKTELLLI